MKFKSRETIEAIQFTGDNGKELDYFICREIPKPYRDWVDSIENTMMLEKGDWVESTGHWDCRRYSDDEFRKYYIPVDDTELPTMEDTSETVYSIELDIHKQILRQEEAKARLCEAEAVMIEMELEERRKDETMGDNEC